MATAWRFYMRMLREHTLPTQMVTGGAIGLGSSMIVQQIIEQQPRQDWKRSARQVVYSSLIFAPMANRMFGLLQRINLSTVWRTAFARTGVDMVTFMPFTSILFFGCMGVMEGRRVEDIKHRWQTNFPDIIRNQYLVFAPAQVINMVFLPLYGRPVFMNLLGLGWTSYLAWMNNRTAGAELLDTRQKRQLMVAKMEI